MKEPSRLSPLSQFHVDSEHCVPADAGGRGGAEGGESEDDSDMLVGEKEMEAYRHSMAVKRAIQMQLGHRFGPRWSVSEGEYKNNLFMYTFALIVMFHFTLLHTRTVFPQINNTL